jgi:hypothetical protein
MIILLPIAVGLACLALGFRVGVLFSRRMLPVILASKTPEEIDELGEEVAGIKGLT